MFDETTVSIPETTDREILFTRIFAAPRELVFQVWTEAEQLAQW